MAGLLAFCGNLKCRAVFEFHGIIGAPEDGSLQLNNITVGPCPRCGSVGHVHNGFYRYIDGVVKLVHNSETSIETLFQLKELFSSVNQKKASRTDILKEAEKISPSFIKAITSPISVGLATWITVVLAIIQIAISYHQDSNKKSDEELKNNLIEVILEQSRTIAKQSQNTIEDNAELKNKHIELQKKNKLLKTQNDSLRKTHYKQPIKAKVKIPRNTKPCPYCNSGKKYKDCCIDTF
jgi:DNA-binding protein H-NS